MATTEQEAKFKVGESVLFFDYPENREGVIISRVSRGLRYGDSVEYEHRYKLSYRQWIFNRTTWVREQDILGLLEVSDAQ